MRSAVVAKAALLAALCGGCAAASPDDGGAENGGFSGSSGLPMAGSTAAPAAGGGGSLPIATAGTTGGVTSPGPMTGAGAGGATGVLAGSGGAGGAAGMLPAGAGGAGVAGMAAPMGPGACCAGGDCLCHGPDPTALTSMTGPFATQSFVIGAGTVYYPTDAEPPFAAVALCGGFLNTGPEMETWGPFYASHGIVTVITTTTGADFPDIRATKLLAAITELKAENMNASSPLSGKLAGRYGTSGYSMGGGGTTIASGTDATLKTSVGLAAWGGVGTGVTVPTLLLCGDADTVAPCNMSQSAYSGIPETTPKMMFTIPGSTHFNWFGPGDAGSGASGSRALAFQKVYLEGDERWKPLLIGAPSGGTITTNIK